MMASLASAGLTLARLPSVGETPLGVGLGVSIELAVITVAELARARTPAISAARAPGLPEPLALVVVARATRVFVLIGVIGFALGTLDPIWTFQLPETALGRVGLGLLAATCLLEAIGATWALARGTLADAGAALAGPALGLALNAAVAWGIGAQVGDLYADPPSPHLAPWLTANAAWLPLIAAPQLGALLLARAASGVRPGQIARLLAPSALMLGLWLAAIVVEPADPRDPLPNAPLVLGFVVAWLAAEVAAWSMLRTARRAVEARARGALAGTFE